MRMHWYYKFLIIFLIFFGLFFLLTENMNSIINSSSYKDYMNFISVPFNFLERYNIFKYKRVLEDKEKLEGEVLSLKIDKDKLASLEEENSKLKELVKLDKLYTDYDMVYSKCIIRNKMYWYSTITIDKGSKSGIKTGSAVVSSFGLIGEVISTTRNSSTVRLITNNSNSSKISVGIKKDKTFRHGIISGFDYPYLKIELTDSVGGITVGDKLVTSGLGNFTKNITIGEVEKVNKDRYGLVNILYVKPYQDVNDINYVGVLVK